MAKRKFSGKKLYELLKLLIIAIAIITGIIAVINFYMGYSNNNILQMYEKICDDYSKERIFPGYKFVIEYDWCMDRRFTEINREIDRVTKTTLISLGITVFLPVLFFGGTALYRYLFPEIEKKEKNEQELNAEI